MKKLGILWVLTGFILILQQSVVAVEWNQVVEHFPNGNINWSEAIIEARGIGAPPDHLRGTPEARPMALRAAQVDAYRNLLETIKGVRIDSKSTIKDFVTQSDTITAEIEGIIRGGQVVKREYLSDGTVEVIMQMKLNGGFAHLILPKDIQPAKTLRPVLPPESLEPKLTEPAEPHERPDQTDHVTSEPDLLPEKKEHAEPQHRAIYTGLIVDARGLSVKPSMSPKILDEDGQEIYGSAFVSREYAVQQGMSGYAKDIKAAQENPRVASNPITVKGVKTFGQGRSDIIISNADASKIRSASDDLSFLQQCRVMIVVD
ncbi:MAG: LPP20 family lipoprotein [Desulfobacterales bacterium]|nr:LPP20 family lipoprotein [Desulfobacterales bacterium]